MRGRMIIEFWFVGSGVLTSLGSFYCVLTGAFLAVSSRHRQKGRVFLKQRNYREERDFVGEDFAVAAEV